MKYTHLFFLNREFHGFQGVKVAFSRNGASFVRYFSEREYGGAEAARKAAEAVRDAILRALEETPDDPQAVFARFGKPSPDLPPGLQPLRDEPGTVPASCTLRNSGHVADALSALCLRFKIGRPSMLKLAVYAMNTLSAQEEFKSITLRQLIAKLESMRTPGSLGWQEYAEGEKDGNDP